MLGKTKIDAKVNAKVNTNRTNMTKGANRTNTINYKVAQGQYTSQYIKVRKCHVKKRVNNYKVKRRHSGTRPTGT